MDWQKCSNSDKIVQKSHKEDIWLHARGVSGSHVIIRMNNSKEMPDKRIIEEVAQFAYQSKAKGAGLAPVIYTKRKYIRKPKGSAYGAVIVQKEQVVIIEPRTHFNEFNKAKKYQESIYLVGFMASGKSAIGKILAQILEKPYLDLDDYIVEKEERSIPQIFNDKGEAYFRTQEWKYILEITQNFKGIVSLGGGALHNQKVVDHIKLYGLMV